MDELIKWVKALYGKLTVLPLPVTILLSSVILGSFYYLAQAKRLAVAERQRLEEIRLEQEAKSASKKALNSCLNSAYNTYIGEWHAQCKASGLLSGKCANLKIITKEEAYKVYKKDFSKLLGYNADDDLAKRQGECSVSLPERTAANLEKRNENRKQECYMKHPQK